MAKAVSAATASAFNSGGNVETPTWQRPPGTDSVPVTMRNGENAIAPTLTSMNLPQRPPVIRPYSTSGAGSQSSLPEAKLPIKSSTGTPSFISRPPPLRKNTDPTSVLNASGLAPPPVSSSLVTRITTGPDNVGRKLNFSDASTPHRPKKPDSGPSGASQSPSSPDSEESEHASLRNESPSATEDPTQPAAPEVVAMLPEMSSRISSVRTTLRQTKLSERVRFVPSDGLMPQEKTDPTAVSKLLDAAEATWKNTRRQTTSLNDIDEGDDTLEYQQFINAMLADAHDAFEKHVQAFNLSMQPIVNSIMRRNSLFVSLHPAIAALLLIASKHVPIKSASIDIFPLFAPCVENAKDATTLRLCTESWRIALPIALGGSDNTDAEAQMKKFVVILNLVWLANDAISNDETTAIQPCIDRITNWFQMKRFVLSDEESPLETIKQGISARDANGRAFQFLGPTDTAYYVAQATIAAKLNSLQMRISEVQGSANVMDLNIDVRLRRFLGQFNHISIRNEVNFRVLHMQEEKKSPASDGYTSWETAIAAIGARDAGDDEYDTTLQRLWCEYFGLLAFVVCVPRTLADTTPGSRDTATLMQISLDCLLADSDLASAVETNKNGCITEYIASGGTRVWYTAPCALSATTAPVSALIDTILQNGSTKKGVYLPFFYPASLLSGNGKPKTDLERMRTFTTATHLGMLDMSAAPDSDDAMSDLSRLRMSTAFASQERLLLIANSKGRKKYTDYLPLAITAHACILSKDNDMNQKIVANHLYMVYTGCPSQPQRKGTGEKRVRRIGTWALLKASTDPSADGDSASVSAAPTTSLDTNGDTWPAWHTINPDIVATALSEVAAANRNSDVRVNEIFQSMTKSEWTTNLHVREFSSVYAPNAGGTNVAGAYMEYLLRAITEQVDRACMCFTRVGFNAFKDITAPLARRILPTMPTRPVRVWQFVRYAVESDNDLHAVLNPLVENVHSKASSDAAVGKRNLIARTMFQMFYAVQAYRKSAGARDAHFHNHERLVRMLVSLVFCECAVRHDTHYDGLSAETSAEIAMAWRVFFSMCVKMPLKWRAGSKQLCSFNGEVLSAKAGGGGGGGGGDETMVAETQFLAYWDLETVRHYVTGRISGFYDLTTPPIELIGTHALPVHNLKIALMEYVFSNTQIIQNSSVSQLIDTKSMLSRAKAASEIINLNAAVQCMKFECRLFSRLPAHRTNTEMSNAKRQTARGEPDNYTTYVKGVIADLMNSVASTTSANLSDAFWFFVWDVAHTRSTPNDYIDAIEQQTQSFDYGSDATAGTHCQHILDNFLNHNTRTRAFRALFAEPGVKPDDICIQVCSVLTTVLRELRLGTIHDMWTAVKNYYGTSGIDKTATVYVVLQTACRASAAIESAFCMRGVQFETLVSATSCSIEEFQSILQSDKHVFAASVNAITNHLALQFVIRVFVAAHSPAGSQLDVVRLLCSDVVAQLIALVELVTPGLGTSHAITEVAISNLLQLVGVASNTTYDPDQLIHLQTMKFVAADVDPIIGAALMVVTNTTRINVILPSEIQLSIFPAVVTLFQMKFNAPGIYTSVQETFNWDEVSPSTVFDRCIEKAAELENAYTDDIVALLNFKRLQEYVNSDEINEMTSHRVDFNSVVGRGIRGKQTDDGDEFEPTLIPHKSLQLTCIAVIACAQYARSYFRTLRDDATSSWTQVVRRALVCLTETAYAEMIFSAKGSKKFAYHKLLLKQKNSLLLCDNDLLTMPLAICAYWDSPGRVLAIMETIKPIFDAARFHVPQLHAFVTVEEALLSSGQKKLSAAGYAVWRAIGSALYGTDVPKAVVGGNEDDKKAEIDSVPKTGENAVVRNKNAFILSYKPTKTPENMEVLTFINGLVPHHKFRVWFSSIQPGEWLNSIERNEWNDMATFKIYSRGLPIPDQYPRSGDNARAKNVNDFERGYIALYNVLQAENKMFSNELKAVGIENKKDWKTTLRQKYDKLNCRKLKMLGKQVYVAIVPYKVADTTYWTPIIVGIPTFLGLEAPQLFDSDNPIPQRFDAVDIRLVFPHGAKRDVGERTHETQQHIASIIDAYDKARSWLQTMIGAIVKHCTIDAYVKNEPLKKLDEGAICFYNKNSKKCDVGNTSPLDAYKTSFAFYSGVGWSNKLHSTPADHAPVFNLHDP